jgi:hypothetical protein
MEKMELVPTLVVVVEEELVLLLVLLNSVLPEQIGVGV